MPIYLILIFLFIASLLESTFIPVPLTLLLIIGLGISAESPMEWVAFAAGIILDILTGRMLGIDSLISLLVLFIIYSYRKKIVAHTVYYLLPFSTVIILIYNYIFYKKMELGNTLVSLSAGVALFIAIMAINYQFQKGRRLTV